MMLWAKEVGKMTASEVYKMTSPWLSLRDVMRFAIFRCAMLLLAANALAATPLSRSRAAPGRRMARRDDFVLRVDAKRAQASIDPDRPFEWQRFLVKEVSEDEIVFTIGAELFEAKLVEADTLILTGTNFRGARVLFRDAALRGTTEEYRPRTSSPGTSIHAPRRSRGSS